MESSYSVDANTDTGNWGRIELIVSQFGEEKNSKLVVDELCKSWFAAIASEYIQLLIMSKAAKGTNNLTTHADHCLGHTFLLRTNSNANAKDRQSLEGAAVYKFHEMINTFLGLAKP